MKKILHIVGARPQFIKLAPFLHYSKDIFENYVLHTGQHYDKNMSDSFFQDLDIPEPDFNLGIGSAKQGEQTAAMLAGIEKILLQNRPDAAVVYGDTNSTLAGALAAVKSGIFTVHIEAGLRSFNRTMPEEINRICADHIANLLFAPTKTAMLNLVKEGLSEKSILSGDIMTDSLAMGLNKSKKLENILEQFNLTENKYYLLTLHRPYTVDKPDVLLNLLKVLNTLDNTVLFPIHPRTANIINGLGNLSLNNIKIIPPQPYLSFIYLMKNCKMLLTDSGGIQKEAYILKKLCVTLRPETEWVETVENGWNVLLNPLTSDFADTICYIKEPVDYKAIFGENVTVRIIQELAQRL